MAAALLSGQPMWVADWEVPAFSDSLQRLVRDWQPDLVQFEFHTMAQYAHCTQNVPRILIAHEPGTAAARDRWNNATGWRRPLLKRDMQSWEVYERTALNRFGAIVCFTDRDRRALLALAPSARIEVIPPRAQVPSENRDPVSATGNTILFVGNFVHPPNVDAGLRLATSIFPSVRNSIPEASLQLVGADPPTELRRRAATNLFVTGCVPDVAPFLAAASVVVAPLRMGGGIRIKVLEALASGKAVVSSPLAAEGLDVRDGEELLIAESDQDFARAISHLLSNPMERQRLEKNARVWATGFARRDRLDETFHRLYVELIHGEKKVH
jgi:glycosyltransferase involved in cell wall biosynthesis